MSLSVAKFTAYPSVFHRDNLAILNVLQTKSTFWCVNSDNQTFVNDIVDY